MIKRTLRQWRRSGKHLWLVSVLVAAKYNYEHARHYLYSRQVLTALDNRKFETDPTPENLVAFVMNNFGASIAPIQDPHEVAELVRRVLAIKPRRVLEIGTARGGLLFLLCQSVASDATIISVDLPHGRNGGGYPQWKEPIFQKFKRPSQTLHLIRGNSHLEETRDQVLQLNQGEKIDFIMIDGDHTYEGVKRDFELYSRLISRDGLIAFHDIVPNRFDPEIEVDRLWRELKLSFSHEEILHDVNQHKFGIGLLSMGDLAPERGVT